MNKKLLSIITSICLVASLFVPFGIRKANAYEAYEGQEITGVRFYEGDQAPITDSAYDFGSVTAKWANGYFDNIHADYLDLAYGVTNLGLVIRYDFVGTPSASDDMYLTFNRGTETDVSILWDEGSDELAINHPDGTQINLTATNIVFNSPLDLGANSFTVNSIEIVGADGEVNASAIEDKFLRNDGNDETSGTITATGFTTVAGTVSAEQLTSTDDADITDNLTAGDIVIDEATGLLAFSGATSASILTTHATQNILTIGGSGATYNENLTFDFETTENKVLIGTGTGVTSVDFGTINLETDALDLSSGNITNAGDISGTGSISGFTSISGTTITDTVLSINSGAITSLTSISDGTATWSSSNLAGFTSISGTTLTDGTIDITGGNISDVGIIYGDGTYLRFGDVATTQHGLDSEDDAMFTGEVEFYDNIYTGGLEFAEDSGLVTAFDMPVSATPADDTVEGYSFAVDGTDILTIYAQADSAGAVDETRVGIGTISPNTLLELSKNSANTPLTISTYHDTEATTPLITLRKADNTEASPALVDDNAVLGTLKFQGYDGSGFEDGAYIQARVDGTPSDGTDMPTELVFAVSADASSTPVERLIISPAGDTSMTGNMARKYTVTTDNTDGVDTYTAAEMFGGLIRRGTGDEITAARIDVTATAANIVASIPGCVVGSGYEFSVANEDSTHTIQVDGGTSVTMLPNDPSTAIPANSTGRFLVVVTNATASSEAVSIHALGYSTH